MTESGFILPMAAGAVLSWASYSIVAHVSIKRQISSLRAISWGILGTLALVLGVCAFSAVSAERTTEKQGAACSGNTPECYAKAHHNPVRECKQVMDNKATFRHVWLESEAKPVFGTYLWHDEQRKRFKHLDNRLRPLTVLDANTASVFLCFQRQYRGSNRSFI